MHQVLTAAQLYIFTALLKNDLVYSGVFIENLRALQKWTIGALTSVKIAFFLGASWHMGPHAIQLRGAWTHYCLWKKCLGGFIVWL